LWFIVLERRPTFAQGQVRDERLPQEGVTFKWKANMPVDSNKPSRGLLFLAVLIAGLAWPAAAMLWLRLGERAFAVSVFGMGLSMGPCLAAYALVPGAPTVWPPAVRLGLLARHGS
jgi:hypothetical protein